MTERMLGTDALLWHMERSGVPMHTLKTVVLDPSRLGRQLTLADVRAAIEPRLGLVPRFTQRVQAAAGFPGRPFWVPAEQFDLAEHLDEVHLPAPGGRDELDVLHSELAARALDRTKPLWAATLVHGLAGGRQAVVVRIHHAITDGLGALNMFLLLTSDTPAGPIPVSPRTTSVDSVSTDTLREDALRAMPSSARRFAHLLVDGLASHRRARSFRREHPDLPRFVGASRRFTNRGGSSERLCASQELDFDLLRTVAKSAGVTINGAYHALIAASMRDELLARREDASSPTVAAFGIAADPSDSSRVHGNHVTPTTVKMFSNIADPVERLLQTARSCKAGVELRKVTGLEMAARWSEYTCRLAAFVTRHGADRLPRVPNHVTTANVAGPKQRRFAGVVEVVDWISFALSIHPANVNITAYSYAGRLSIGLVTTPGALPDPRRFLQRMEAELTLLATQLGVAKPVEAPKSMTGDRS